MNITDIIDFAKQVLDMDFKLKEANNKLAKIESVISLYELKEANNKLAKIESVISLAEEWADQQTMSQEVITLSALKDIRRIVRGNDNGNA